GAPGELDLEDVEEIANDRRLFEVVDGQAQVEPRLDLDDETDDVHRIEADVLAQACVLVEVFDFLAAILLQNVAERVLNLSASHRLLRGRGTRDNITPGQSGTPRSRRPVPSRNGAGTSIESQPTAHHRMAAHPRGVLAGE